MTTYYAYLAVIGRVHGDDEDSVELYEHMTADDAKQAFHEDMQARQGVPSDDVVYINYVLASDAPITMVGDYTGFP